jgi:hypothetical protein
MVSFNMVVVRSAAPTRDASSSGATACKTGAELEESEKPKDCNSGAPQHPGNCKVSRHQFVTIARRVGDAAGETVDGDMPTRSCTRYRRRRVFVSDGDDPATDPCSAADYAVLATKIGDTCEGAASTVAVSEGFRGRLLPIASISRRCVDRRVHGASERWQTSDGGVHCTPQKPCLRLATPHISQPTMRASIQFQ